MRSKNGRSQFKLALGHFSAIFSPQTKFHQNRMRNTKVENFRYWSVLVGPAGRSEKGRRHLKLILCCFWAIISPHTKFHPNRTENTEVENFRYWSVLVGRATRTKNCRKHFKLILCCFWAIISPHTKFHPNRAGRSKNGRIHFKHSESVQRLTNDLCTKFEPTQDENWPR